MMREFSGGFVKSSEQEGTRIYSLAEIVPWMLVTISTAFRKFGFMFEPTSFRLLGRTISQIRKISFWAILSMAFSSCQSISYPKPPTASLAYEKSFLPRMQAKWQQFVSQKAGQLSPGRIRVRFEVAPDGRVYNLKIVDNTGNDLMPELAMRTVLETRISPIPKAVLAETSSGHVTNVIDFNVKYGTP